METLPALSAFQNQIDSRFTLRTADRRAVPLVLSSVRDGGQAAGIEQFSVLFRAPPDAPVEQSIYRLEHETLGSMELFLVPIGRDASGVEYEAVFNRRLTGDSDGAHRV